MTRPSFSPSLCGLAWGLLLVAAYSVSAGEPEAAGVVRISKPAGSAVVRAQSDEILLTGCKECEEGWGGSMHGGAMSGMHSGWDHMHGGGMGYGDCDCDACRNGKWGKHSDKWEYFKCKFGFLIPTGCGGYGCPPIGKYARVYPQDPSYFDQRDGQAYGAAGYGMPIAVPLAPVVSHQYNYSWGVPSSRLTPVSRLAPY